MFPDVGKVYLQWYMVPCRVGFGDAPGTNVEKIGWPRMDGCENCQGNALLLIHGRGTRQREGPRAPPLDVNVSCDERGRHRRKGTKSTRAPAGYLAPGVAVRYSVPSLC